MISIDNLIESVIKSNRVLVDYIIFLHSFYTICQPFTKFG
jgi:hypothetical protein